MARHWRTLYATSSKWSQLLTQPDDLIDALEPVIKLFRELGIQHFIGGSIASSYHGATRSTMDVDVVCSMGMDQVSRFVSNLAGDYYVSLSAAQAAIRSKSCFNLIHLATSFKVGVFVSRGRPSDVESMRRATLGKLGVTRTLEVPIATAEDMIISKLEWFQLTGRTSERQWNDVFA